VRPGMLGTMKASTISEPGPPVSTPDDTVDDLVRRSQRRGKSFPLRQSFLQRSGGDQEGAGPLAGIVNAGDHRALLLYLLLLMKASSSPWSTALPATVWARALAMDLPETKSATSTISKAWLRLESRRLISRGRSKRMANVTLLREDGTGSPYTSPGADGDWYIKVPVALWQSGPPKTRWYRVLNLPELAFLLIARSHGDGFRLPFEEGPRWYGISADSLARGAHGLQSHGLLSIEKNFKKAPLTAAGYTAENRYTLQAPFGPIGKASSAAKRSQATVSP
jgi:hypothetical protein